MEKFNNLGENHIRIISDFYSEKDVYKGIEMILEEICILCNIDRMQSIVRNDSADEYIEIFEYTKEKGFIIKAGKNIGYYVNLLFNTETENMKKFKSIFNDDIYFRTNDFSQIKDIIKSVGYNTYNESKIKDFYIFLADNNQTLFIYSAFERHLEEPLSDNEIKFITSLCKVMNDRVINLSRSKKHINELLLRNIVLESESVPMAVIEKETYKVIYHNDLYYELIPNIKIGAYCDELLGYDEKGLECCIEKNILITSPDNKRQWIKKSIPFTLTNGREVFMIYSKDATDYVNEINAVDKLTKALLIRGFEEYYKTFVKRSTYNYALCSIDIDKFKYINNTLGYELGDKILKKIVQVIRSVINTEENFCRIGEDKFSVFIQYKDDMELHWKLKNLINSFEEMRVKFFEDTRITIISGVTIVNKELPLNTLLDQATTARKSIKGSLNNAFSYYNADIDLSVQKEIQLEEQIPHAIANDEFKAFLQPKFKLETKKISGAEALVRWITPKGMIFPDQFIPLFEKNGFILELDFIVYNKVMEFIRKSIDNGLPVYPISVNVSRNHIKDEKFVDKFMDIVNKYKVPHEYLELEVTESVFIEDRKELKDFITKIKKENLKVSIDDFGTGYSSLQTLTDIDVDILKIDKGFLDNVNCEEDSKVISKDKILIKNIISLAKELDFEVICEGVETDNQINFLKSIGCELGQGYVFARPMSIEDYEKNFLKN